MERQITNSAYRLALLAAFGSFVLLAAAFAFQHFGGLAPCKMCIWQRWPHLLAVLVGGLVLLNPRWYIMVIGAIAAATTAGVGFYHAGVEKGIFEGPSTCTAGAVDPNKSASDLLDQILAAPVVRCDEIVWDLAGISMAGWNGIASALLCCLWMIAAFRAYAGDSKA